MRILLLSPQPFFEIRGTPLNIRQLVKVLVKLGHQVDIVTYHLGVDVHIKGVRIHRIWSVPFVKQVPVGPSYIKMLLDIFLFFKALSLGIKNRYSIIHAVEESVFLGIVLKRMLGLPFLYDMDSSIPHQLTYTKFVRSGPFINLVERLERVAIGDSLLVLTVCSELTQRVLRKCPQKMVFQIEDTPVFTSDEKHNRDEIDNFRKRWGINDERVILYTGNFQKYQGLDLMVKSIPMVVKTEEKVKFVLVGGEDGQVKEMSDLCKSLNIKDFVVLTGKRPLEEISFFLEMADILLSPRVEGSNTPLKIFTYLQSGRPIVATDLPTHTQVLNGDVAVLVEPEPDAFAKGIIRLLTDKQVREELSERGKKLVGERYGYQAFSKKVEEVYKFVEKKVRLE